jgi:hypothetical protein
MIETAGDPLSRLVFNPITDPLVHLRNSSRYVACAASRKAGHPTRSSAGRQCGEQPATGIDELVEPAVSAVTTKS